MQVCPYCGESKEHWRLTTACVRRGKFTELEEPQCATD
jgi:hypothetical protein